MTKKILILFGLTGLLAGCGGGMFGSDSGRHNNAATSAPTDVQDNFIYSTSLYGSDDGGPRADIAVLLPSNGIAKSHGNEIKTSIETAFLRKPKSNVKITFFDVSGSLDERYDVITSALDTDPDVIIGPLFAEDAKILRDIKPSNLPVISFTSDTSSLGDGVMTVNLIPTQSIETIVRQMQNDTTKGTILLAPDDKSGQTMTSVADMAAKLYNVPVHGIFYYTPGHSDSIKDAAMRASLYKMRNGANTRAREVLSDILTNEKLSSTVRDNLSKQLEKISRTETLGELPYDSILFLGNGNDSKKMASFLRYYGVGNRDVAFYGTTLWHDSNIASDFTMSGAKYATLPEISGNFVSLYNFMTGKDPNYLSAFGYDAANLALGMIYSQKSGPAYFFDPSGYIGANGVFRIQPTGESERALRIMELDGSGEPKTFKNAPDNFLVPLYNIHPGDIKNVSEREIKTRGINPGDYIDIPEDLRKKSEYKMKKIGTNYEPSDTTAIAPIVSVQPAADSETISNPEFQPVKLENISRQYIDSVEIEE